MTGSTCLGDYFYLAFYFVQPGKPKMVMEFWSGWFDHWGDPHVPRKHSAEEVGSQTRDVLDRGISVNYYMFHGEGHTLPIPS